MFAELVGQDTDARCAEITTINMGDKAQIRLCRVQATLSPRWFARLEPPIAALDAGPDVGEEPDSSIIPRSCSFQKLPQPKPDTLNRSPNLGIGMIEQTQQVARYYSLDMDDLDVAPLTRAP